MATKHIHARTHALSLSAGQSVSFWARLLTFARRARGALFFFYFLGLFSFFLCTQLVSLSQCGNWCWSVSRATLCSPFSIAPLCECVCVFSILFCALLRNYDVFLSSYCLPYLIVVVVVEERRALKVVLVPKP